MTVYSDVFEQVKGDLRAIRFVEFIMMIFRTEDSYATLILVDQLLKVKSRFWRYIIS